MIIINCKNKKLGRISSVISKLIIYLNIFKKYFRIYLINYDKILNNKTIYITHSGFIGHLKKKFLTKKKIIKKSIFNMLPKNKNRIFLIKKIYFQ